MPSASQEVIDYMGSYHGPGFSDSTAMGFLEERGFILTESWEWIAPDGKTLETIDQDEWMHVLYLIQEWDFGGLTNHP